MDRHIWFGTKDYARWIPAPAVANYAGGAANWNTRQNYLNGGAYVRNSYGSHREYSLSWNLRSQRELNPIIDFAQGMYGQGLIYWVDPFAAYTNVLPKDLATPYLGALDGVIITGNTAALDVRPTLVPTSSNPHGFPIQSASIVGNSSTFARRFYIPIPPGHDFIMRAWGAETNGVVRYYTQQTNQAAFSLGWSTVDSMTAGSIRRINGGTTGSGVEVYLGGSGGTAAGIATGAMAQIVKAGEPGNWESFQSGQGNSGCRFEGVPQSSPYSAALDKVGMSAKLVEVGAWL